MKLLAATTRFVNESGRIRTPESRRSFLKVVRHLDSWAGGMVELDELDSDLLTDWCLAARADGGKPSPSTIRKRRAHARSFFAWAKWKGLIDSNPASDLEFSVVPGRGNVRTHTWLTEQQAVAMFDLPSKPTIADERNRIIIMLGVLCGLRAGVEMAQLRWDWFNPDLSQLTVHEGKGGKTEVIGVPPQLQQALADWSRRRPYGATAVLPRMRLVFDPGAAKRVWMIDWDKPLGYDGIRLAVRKVGDRHGVKLAPHDLRRTFAGILEARGVEVSNISRAMRHSDVGITSRYLEKNPSKTVAVTSGLVLGGDR